MTKGVVCRWIFPAIRSSSTLTKHLLFVCSSGARSQFHLSLETRQRKSGNPRKIRRCFVSDFHVALLESWQSKWKTARDNFPPSKVWKIPEIQHNRHNPWKLMRIDGWRWKVNFLLRWPIFRDYVSFREGKVSIQKLCDIYILYFNELSLPQHYIYCFIIYRCLIPIWHIPKPSTSCHG